MQKPASESSDGFSLFIINFDSKDGFHIHVCCGNISRQQQSSGLQPPVDNFFHSIVQYCATFESNIIIVKNEKFVCVKTIKILK